MDLEAGIVAIRHTLQRSGGGFSLAEPKPESSRRDLPVPEFVVALLREHQDRQRREREQAGDDWEDWGLVFTTRRGTHIDAATLLH